MEPPIFEGILFRWGIGWDEIKKTLVLAMRFDGLIPRNGADFKELFPELKGKEPDRAEPEQISNVE